MTEKPERDLDLLAHLEAVDDLSEWKREWEGVYEPIFKSYDVTTGERVLVIDELYRNYTEYEEEDVQETDVVSAIHTVRAAGQDLH